MTEKMTKRERIAALTRDGMTRVEAEFEVARQDLEAQEAAVEAAAVEVVKRDFADTWEVAVATAREQVLKPKRGRKTTKKATPEDTESVTENDTARVAETTGFTGF